MEVEALVAELEGNGWRLAEVAEAAGLGAAVPSCPGWTVGDLVRHLGGVHRWAAHHVTTGSAGPTSDEEEVELFRSPGDPALLGWFRDGHRRLVEALLAADPELDCWTFLPAPSPLAFWARRQALETAVHRVDVELATGSPSPVALPLALAGVEELLRGFLARRRSKLVADPPRTLCLRATDSGEAWTVRIEADRRVVTDGELPADCRLAGSAGDLYLVLWNRPPVGEVAVAGDASLLESWQQLARITWT